VLTLTDSAATEIRNLVADPQIPEDGGVRIASNADGALTLALASGPAEGDDVVDQDGARVFLEPHAGELLDDKLLDAGVDTAGNLQFSIGQQAS
jgi:Fe-S cluster assembly iron-binding protein IscA